MKGKCIGFFHIVAVLVLTVAIAGAQVHAQTGEGGLIRVVTPAENTEVIGKKPDIKIEFLAGIDPRTVVVILDGIDVTPVGVLNAQGFEYKPVMAIPSGQHILTIIAADSSGVLFQRNVMFTTRHSSTFDEASSNNDISVIYEAALIKPDSAESVPYSKLEGNIRSDSKVKKRNYEFAFNTNIRYFDQSLPVMSVTGASSVTGEQQIIRKGFSLANFLLTGRYMKDPFQLVAELGDVQISETQNTVSGLARRGGKLSVEYNNFSAGTFLVKGERVFGFRGGFGIDGTMDDNIFGLSAGVKLFDRKAEIKTVYVTGGEPGNSVAISTGGGIPIPGGLATGAHTKGDVIGTQLITDFFENRFRTEMEIDFSRFDPDTSDDVGRKPDRAYRFKAGGALGRYNYEARYEYYGRDYAVIGMQGALKDTRLFGITNSLSLDDQNIILGLKRSNDNVRGDSMFARTVTYDGLLAYTFNKIQNLPVALSYQKIIEKSKDEPSNNDEINLHVDTVIGSIGYVTGPLNVTFTSSYSLKNDKTALNTDSTTITNMVTPAYSTEYFTLSPMVSWNRTKEHVSKVWTDTYLAGFNLYSFFLQRKLAFDAGSTYTVVKADDDSVKTRNLNANFRLGYNLKNLIRIPGEPSIAFKGLYHRNKDEINSSANRNEFLVFLVFSTNIPVSF